MSYVDKSIKSFIDNLASKTPTPGGGSVAALLGALGCGLLSMVANYTLAKKGFNGYKERAVRALKEAELTRKKLIELIDKDIKAYEGLSKLLKNEKAGYAKLASAYKKAVNPPLKICYYVHKAASVALDLAFVGNKSIISDVSVAIYALDAAFESALVNIGINLKYLKEKKYKTDKTHLCSELQRDMKRLKTDVLSQTKMRIFS